MPAAPIEWPPMECVKGSDLAMNGSDDLERARSRDIVANHTFERSLVLKQRIGCDTRSESVT
jgi:hypothetical protein